MFCVKCGGNMPEGSAVCPSCGSPVAPSISPLLPQAMPPAPVAVLPPTDGKATASLILGIASLLCLPFLAGIPAIILGHMSRSSIRQSMGRLRGEGMALAGLIMGYVSAVSSGLFLIALFGGMLAYLIPFGLYAGQHNRSSAPDDQQPERVIRSINTSQVMYQVTYSDRGYARDLATLGQRPGDNCPSAATAEHACLLTGELGGPECTDSFWCTKGGYKFQLRGASCKKRKCDGYLVVATPEDEDNRSRRFCSTDDGVIHYQPAATSSSLPATVTECRSWPPL